MSEADNIVNKKKVTISSDSKKKIKNDKNIFVVTTKKENNNTEEDSVFAKTEVISLSDVMKIKKSLNNKMLLQEIQKIALKFQIPITEGSTKNGKPKNRTKDDLYKDIELYIKNYKK